MLGAVRDGVETQCAPLTAHTRLYTLSALLAPSRALVVSPLAPLLTLYARPSSHPRSRPSRLFA
eukprot:3933896-Rhodomonas_salina.3